MIPLKFERLDKHVEAPKYETPGSSGMDIKSNELSGLFPGEFKLIATGLKVKIEEGYELQVRPRSGLASKRGLTILNTPGTIDSDYRGEIKICLINHSKEYQIIEIGDRIAQLVLAKVERAHIYEGMVQEDTTRGSGGFGSTGI
jgi:dUTP pyrophosphatase